MKTNMKRFPVRFLSLLLTLLALWTVGFGLPPSTWTILADGRQTTVYTNARSAVGVLQEADIELGEFDKVVTEGRRLTVTRAVPVTVVSGGRRRDVMTTEATAEAAVIAAGYDPSRYVALLPSETKITAGLIIPVEPYTTRSITVDEPVAYKVIREPNGRMAKGEERITAAGYDGLARNTYTVYSVNGREVKRQRVATAELVAAQPEVREIGTRDTVDTARGSLRYEKKMVMEATAYHPMDGDGRGITYSGIPAAYGIVAVDPAVIPIGTRVYVPGYGEAIAADTGGAIIGNRIDLCMESYDECYAYGRRYVDVYILK